MKQHPVPYVKNRDWFRQVRVPSFDSCQLNSEQIKALCHCTSEPWLDIRSYRDILSASPQIMKEKFAKNTIEIFPLIFNTKADYYSSHYLRPQGIPLTHA